jgi:biopolymer transport protein ExbB/TolQ
MSASPADRGRRSGTNLAAFVLGVPVAAAIIAAFHFGPIASTEAARYLKHEVECVEVLMACVALAGLVAKMWSSRRERAALNRDLVPAWDGKTTPVADAAGLLAALDRQPSRWKNTYLGRRIGAVLEFLCSRGSASELDDQMRSLADADAVALEGSYALIRFITWAVPILGFLGTVLGITQSIANISPEQLEKDLGSVTHGLALAFDATALALGLTMIVMFVNYLAERLEQGVLEQVDSFVERQLAHRFERIDGEANDFVGALRLQSQQLMQTTGQLVEKQAEVWALALDQAEKRRTEAEQQVQGRLTGALETALEQTLEAHAKRLASLEKQSGTQTAALLEKITALAASVRDAGRDQQALLAKIASGLNGQADALARLQEGEKQLLILQDTLQHNLNTLAGAGTFEQAVHSLTAAIHLLTLHSTPKHVEPVKLHRPGAAA